MAYEKIVKYFNLSNDDYEKLFNLYNNLDEQEKSTKINRSNR